MYILFSFISFRYFGTIARSMIMDEQVHRGTCNKQSKHFNSDAFYYVYCQLAVPRGVTS